VNVLLMADTVLLGLVMLLTAGLLRSHAAILASIDGGEHGATAERPRAATGVDTERVDPQIASPAESGAARDEVAPDLSGVTPAGDFVQFGMRPGGPPLLLAFLSGGCSTCESFWEAFGAKERPLPGGARPIIVTKGPEEESRSRLRKLMRGEVEVVMSSEAWDDYEVPTYPYFAYIDGGTARIYGVGSAGSWSQLESLMTDALEDAALSADPTAARTDAWSGRRAQRGRARSERIDAELAGGGIGPDHPSLYAAPHANAPDEEDVGAETGGPK
jgi:hypothetical protein